MTKEFKLKVMSVHHKGNPRDGGSSSVEMMTGDSSNREYIRLTYDLNGTAEEPLFSKFLPGDEVSMSIYVK